MTLTEAIRLACEKYPIENPNCQTERIFKKKMREEYVKKLLEQKKN